MEFNRKMSAVSAAVEHNYKDLKQFWTSQDFARNLKVGQASIALIYKYLALLLNMRACLYQRRQVADMFEQDSSPIDVYLNSV